MKIFKKKNILIFNILLVIMFLFIGCVEKEKEVVKIDIANYEEIKEVELDTFDVDDIKIRLYYIDDSTKDIRISEDMLSAADNYKLSQVGEHTVTINYGEHSVEVFIKIIEEFNSIALADISLGKTEYEYTGFPIEPTVKVVLDEKVLVNKGDYEIEYLDNKNVGTGIVKVTGVGSYCGTVYLVFDIKPINLVVKVNDLSIFVNETPNYSVIYDGFVGYDNENSLSGRLVFDCEYSTSEEGEYEIKVSGLSSDNYNITYENGTLTTRIIEFNGVNIELTKIDYTYNGLPIIPEYKVMLDDVELNKEDYDVEYVDNVNAGSAKIIVTGKGQYLGKAEKTFEIMKKDLFIKVSNYQITYLDSLPNFYVTYDGFVNGENENSLGGSLVIKTDTTGNVGKYPITISGLTSDNYELIYLNGTLEVVAKEITSLNIKNIKVNYTGYNIENEIEVLSGSYKLNESEYKVSYSNNKDVGLATITIEGINNFSGYLTKSFTIVAVDLLVSVSSQELTYGESLLEHKCTFEGFVGEDDVNSLTGEATFTTNYQNKVGNYYVIVSGYKSKNYNIKYDNGTIKINPYTVKASEFSLLETAFEYCNQAIKPKVVNTLNATEGIDYTVTYENNFNAGKGTLKIKCKGNYLGEIEKEFTISKKSATISAQSYSIIYGNSIPEFKYFVLGVYDNDKTINGEISISCTVDENANAGSYDIIISGYQSDNYTFEYNNAKLLITPKELNDSNIQVNAYEYMYTGSNIECEIVVKDNEKELVKDTDFRVSYSNNTNVGIAKYTVEFIGNYNGSVTKEYEIKKRNLRISTESISLDYLSDVPNYLYKIEGLDDCKFEYTITPICSYQKGDIPGIYKIFFNRIIDDNFNIEYSEGYLEITCDKVFEGEGTKENPYQISSISEFSGLSLLLNENSFENKYFVLTCDLNYNGFGLLTIGTQNYPFKGNFDFNGHIISNAKIVSNTPNVGIFGVVKGGSISNLLVKNVSYELEDTDEVFGTITGKIIDSELLNISIENVLVKGNVKGIVCGGVVGDCDSSILRNISTNTTIDINAKSENVMLAGISGVMNNSTLKDSYSNSQLSSNTGKIAGITSTSNRNYLYNIFVLGALKSSQNIVINEYFNSKLYTYTENLRYSKDLLVSSEGYVNNGDEQSYILEVMKKKWDNIWIFGEGLPKHNFEVKKVNKPTSLEKVYDGTNKLDGYGYFVSTDTSIANVGTYQVTIELQQGFTWSDDTFEPITVQLTVVKKELIININDVFVSVSTPYESLLSFTTIGFVNNDRILEDDIKLYVNCQGEIGDYEINILDITFDNYELVVNKGYLHLYDTVQGNNWSVWDGTYQDGLFEGEGTLESPYLINNANDLATLAYKANNGQDTNYYYKLTCNIDLNRIEWPVIGKEYYLYPFKGHFDGNGYKIYNLRVTESKTYSGLFGHLLNATITNLKVEAASINVNNRINIFTGILASWSENSVISKVSVSGKINASCYFSGLYVGGLVGLSGEGTNINNSYTNVEIICNDLANESLQNKVYVGGITGYGISITLTNVYSSGSIFTKSTYSESYVGGIIGYVEESQLNNVINYANVSSSSLPGVIYALQSNCLVLEHLYYLEGVVVSRNGEINESYYNGLTSSTKEYLLENVLINWSL